MHPIDLTALPSPILFQGDDHTAYRDPTAIYHDGWFHLFFTLVEIEPDGQVYMYLGKSKSQDLLHWEPIRKQTPRDRRLNYSSPGNLIRFQDQWLICLQTYCRENGEKYGNERCRLYTMSSRDLEHFSPPRMLMVKGDCPIDQMGRMIDPYLLQDAAVPNKWWCFYKQNGVSMSYSFDLENWTFAGHANAGENVCVVRHNDTYYMFHSPHNGIGIMTSTDCLCWQETGILITLDQPHWPWAQGRLTAGFVMEAPAACQPAAKWIMFFHGSGPEDEQTMMDCHASLGIAWSQDLLHWQYPRCP